MGWLDLPNSMSQRAAVPYRSQLARLDNITSLNILGMGGSSLTPEVLSNLFSDSQPELNVFDTVNPATISNAIENLDLESAAFAVASKSGTTVEPLSLESVFRDALEARDIGDVASHFVAISDPETPLANRAVAGELGLHIETPPNVGGRFSALTAFGMFLLKSATCPSTS